MSARLLLRAARGTRIGAIAKPMAITSAQNVATAKLTIDHPMSETNGHLEHVKDCQIAFKTPVLLAYAVQVVKVAAAFGQVWPDDIDTAHIQKKDRNCIGTVFIILKNVGILTHSRDFRKSKAAGRKGSTIFKYALASQSLATAFLKRHTPEGSFIPGQQELPL